MGARARFDCAISLLAWLVLLISSSTPAFNVLKYNLAFSYLILLRDFLLVETIRTRTVYLHLNDGVLSSYTRFLISATQILGCTFLKDLFVRCGIFRYGFVLTTQSLLCIYYIILFIVCQYFF